MRRATFLHCRGGSAARSWCSSACSSPSAAGPLETLLGVPVWAVTRKRSRRLRDLGLALRSSAPLVYRAVGSSSCLGLRPTGKQVFFLPAANRLVNGRTLSPSPPRIQVHHGMLRTIFDGEVRVGADGRPNGSVLEIGFLQRRANSNCRSTKRVTLGQTSNDLRWIRSRSRGPRLPRRHGPIPPRG